MKLSVQGLKFIQNQEGLRLSPYQDVAGNWTIGYGHLMTDEEISKWPPGSSITEGTALLLLEADVEEARAAWFRRSQEQWRTDWSLLICRFGVEVEPCSGGQAIML